jgi:hypothetical protein
MAATVRSGTGNFSYTNNTAGNVRVIINYYTNGPGAPNGAKSYFLMSWGTASIDPDDNSQDLGTVKITFGRNLAFTGNGYNSANNMTFSGSNQTALPTEIMLAAGETFTVTAKTPTRPLGAYNIVIIPEAG